jgi:hypothetical protein
LLQKISQAEFDAFMASVKSTLFKDTVRKAEYTNMKQVGYSATSHVFERLSYHLICCSIVLGACSVSMVPSVLQERDKFSSRVHALEKRCKESEKLIAEFIGSVGSLQASWVARAKTSKDA